MLCPTVVRQVGLTIEALTRDLAAERDTNRHLAKEQRESWIRINDLYRKVCRLVDRHCSWEHEEWYK